MPGVPRFRLSVTRDILTIVASGRQFRRLRGLIRAVDAGEVADLTRSRLGVEAFDIALFNDFERRRDVDFDEFAVFQQVAGHLAFGAEGGDEGDEGDQARVDHQLRHFGDAADVFDAVGVGEA